MGCVSSGIVQSSKPPRADAARGSLMTRTTNARLAGAAFLVDIAAGVPDMVLSARVTAGATVAAKLTSVALHATEARISILLVLVQALCALFLGVTLYSLTREEDRDIAMFGLVCRAGEGLLAAVQCRNLVGLLWLAAHPAEGNPITVQAVGTYLLRVPSGNLGAIFFALGSTAFAWLLLRGRMIPRLLAVLGVVASLLLVVVLPLQLTGWLRGSVAAYAWIPMAAYEIPLAVWLLVKGAPLAAPVQGEI